MNSAQKAASFFAGLKAVFPLGTVCAVLVFIATDRLVYVDPPAVRATSYRFDFFMASSVAGSAQVMYDLGRGFNSADMAELPVIASDAPLPYMFPIAAGKVRRLRIDFLMGPGIVSINNARLVGQEGNEIRKIRPEEFTPNDHISSSRQDPDGVTAVAPDGVNDPYYIITFDPPVRLRAVDGVSVTRNPWARAALIAIIFTLLGAISHGAQRWTPRWRSQVLAVWSAWGQQRPRACLFGIALLATITSCYPVIFFGRSFVSPNIGSLLLYNGPPTIPGLSSAEYENVQAADVGAMMWQNLPYSHIEHRAIFNDGELPLWNRFSSAGVPLLGQGQAMLGDPLHALVIVAGGSAWAWDAKFVAARLLFCNAIGWLAFAATRHLPASALITFAAAFIGFFHFRINHPAIFAICYAPWILLAWVQFAASKHPRTSLGWLVAILVANVSVFASGTIKETTMSIASLNTVGLVALLAAPRPWRERFRSLIVVTAGVLAGLLIGAPLWLTFLGTLREAHTFSDGINIVTRPWRLLVALFDGIFLQESFDGRPVVAPSANFLLLLGVLLYLLRLPLTFRDRLSATCFLGAFVASLLAFGIVPLSWIAAVPGLRHVGHVHNTFSCVAIILLFVPAARGLADAFTRAARGGVGIETLWVLLIGGGLIALFFTVDPARWWKNGFSDDVASLAHQRGYFVRTLGLLLASWAVFLAVFSRRCRTGRWAPALVILALAALIPLLARHGQRTQRGHDDYFFRPMERPDFFARSPAVDFIQRQSSEPLRVGGVAYSLFPGYSSVVGLEGINGPDALMSREYRELALATGLAIPTDWYFPSSPEALAASRPILDLLNVVYYLANPISAAPGANVEKVAELDMTVYRSPTAWPRAFFTDSVAVGATAEAVASLLRNGDGRPFAAMREEERTAAGVSSGEVSNRIVRAATNYRLTNNTTSFEVEATGPGIAVLSETDWPGAFTAWLNGQQVPVWRVNHAFKGAMIPNAGRHHLLFRYEPRHFRLSLGLGAVGLVGFAGLAWFLWRRPVGASPPAPLAST